jgi:nucleoside phosphorylase
MAGLLVIAATEPELAGAAGARSLACGIGPVEAAAATADALARRPASAVLHVGLAGSRSLAPLTVVLGSEAVYSDLAAAIPLVDRAAPDSGLLDVARRAVPGAVVAPIGTSARVGGVEGCDVEAMEGFAVLRAAERAGVPAVELRVVVNDPDESDRALWRFADGLALLERTLRPLVVALTG